MTTNLFNSNILSKEKAINGWLSLLRSLESVDDLLLISTWLPEGDVSSSPYFKRIIDYLDYLNGDNLAGGDINELLCVTTNDNFSEKSHQKEVRKMFMEFVRYIFDVTSSLHTSTNDIVNILRIYKDYENYRSFIVIFEKFFVGYLLYRSSLIPLDLHNTEWNHYVLKFIQHTPPSIINAYSNEWINPLGYWWDSFLQPNRTILEMAKFYYISTTWYPLFRRGDVYALEYNDKEGINMDVVRRIRRGIRDPEPQRITYQTEKMEIEHFLVWTDVLRQLRNSLIYETDEGPLHERKRLIIDNVKTMWMGKLKNKGAITQGDDLEASEEWLKKRFRVLAARMIVVEALVYDHYWSPCITSMVKVKIQQEMRLIEGEAGGALDVDRGDDGKFMLTTTRMIEKIIRNYQNYNAKEISSAKECLRLLKKLLNEQQRKDKEIFLVDQLAEMHRKLRKFKIQMGSTNTSFLPSFIEGPANILDGLISMKNWFYSAGRYINMIQFNPEKSTLSFEQHIKLIQSLDVIIRHNESSLLSLYGNMKGFPEFMAIFYEEQRSIVRYSKEREEDKKSRGFTYKLLPNVNAREVDDDGNQIREKELQINRFIDEMTVVDKKKKEKFISLLDNWLLDGGVDSATLENST